MGSMIGTVLTKAAPVLQGIAFELGRSIVKETLNYISTKAAVNAALKESDMARQVNHIERIVMSYGQ